MVVYRFFTGDENGLVKSIKFNVPSGRLTPQRPVVTTVATVDERAKAGPVQLMATGQAVDGSHLVSPLAVSRGSGSTSIRSYIHKSEDILPKQEWSEPRFKPLEDTFIGLSLSPQGTYTCTSRGHLRLTPHQTNDQTVGTALPAAPLIAYLPTRLKAFQLSPIDQRQFAYGGDEVELSLWDVERAFTKGGTRSEREGAGKTKVLKKGRKKEKLFAGEIWRSRNVPHDFLNIRDQVHITALSFLQPVPPPVDEKSSSSCATNLITGSLSGAPGHGGVKAIERGYSEYVDVRNGRIAYKYPAISGAIVSVACTPPSVSSLVPTAVAPPPSATTEASPPTSEPSVSTSTLPLPTRPPHLASVSLDRFIRLHTAPIPPPDPTQNSVGLVPAKHGIDGRGKVLAKEFLKGTPTCVVWDVVSGVFDLEDEIEKKRRKQQREIEEEEAIWQGMEVAGTKESSAKRKRKPRSQDDDSDDNDKVLDDDSDEEEEPTAKRKVK
ncbi:hypothetical protein FRB97_004566 [Tulasnella sp. 331]|nr:hypothetical protein FRB97_004566 [Tulasnella sp. 331]